MAGLDDLPVATMPTEPATKSTQTAKRKERSTTGTLITSGTTASEPAATDTNAAGQEIPAVISLAPSDTTATEAGTTNPAFAGKETEPTVSRLKQSGAATAEAVATGAVATDALAMERDEGHADTCLPTSDNAETESSAIDKSSTKQNADLAAEYLAMAMSGIKQSRVCSPRVVRPRPPLDYQALVLKLWHVYARDQCGLDIELPCLVKPDRWNSNSTPPSSFWASVTTASPTADKTAPVSTDEDSPGQPKTPSSQYAASGTMASKRKFYNWWNCNEYTSESESLEGNGRRQKRWIGN